MNYAAQRELLKFVHLHGPRQCIELILDDWEETLRRSGYDQAYIDGHLSGLRDRLTQMCERYSSS